LLEEEAGKTLAISFRLVSDLTSIRIVQNHILALDVLELIQVQNKIK